MNTYITNFSEAQDEARRLSKVLRRDVEVAPVNCDCDYSPLCYRCAASGTYYELRFGFCDHVVQDGDDLECISNDCERGEREASLVERPDTFPRVGAQLRSCSQVEAQQEEAEYEASLR